MLLGHLQELASTLGSMLVVTILLQVSQQSEASLHLGLLTAANPGAPGTSLTSFPLISPQTLVLLGLRYLQTALEGLGGVIDGEGETQGYLLPSGLRDMLKTAWLRGGVDHRPAPEEGPPEEAPPKEGLPEA